MAPCPEPMTNAVVARRNDNERDGQPTEREPAAGGESADNSPAMGGEEKALALLIKHPDWSNAEIARHVPCHRTTLYRWTRFTMAREQQEMGRLERRKGSKHDGRIEAW